MTLKRPKKKGSGAAKKRKGPVSTPTSPHTDGEDEEANSDVEDSTRANFEHFSNSTLTADAFKDVKSRPDQGQKQSIPDSNVDLEDPNISIPLPRYNAMLAVLRNTLYM